MENLLWNGAIINEKDVKNISVEETDDFEKEQIDRESFNFRLPTYLQKMPSNGPSFLDS